MFPSMPYGFSPGPGPYGLPYPSPTGMPLPREFPTPPSPLPPLPLPPWLTGQAMPEGVMGGPPVQQYPMQQYAAPMQQYAAPMVSFQASAPSPPHLPPSALDLQTTASFNPVTSHVPLSEYPRIDDTVFVAPHATVLGDVRIGEDVFIGFGAVLRADYGSPFFIGPRSNIQDHVVVHGEPEQFVEAEDGKWSVHLAGEVSCLHNAVLHGPLKVGRNVYIGEGAMLHTAEIGDGCVIMHGATVVNGVRIPPGRLVAPGQTVWRQSEADALPEVPAEFRQLNPMSIQGYVELARSYRSQMPVAM